MVALEVVIAFSAVEHVSTSAAIKHIVGMDSCLAAGADHLIAVGIVADLANHGNICPQSGHLNSLIGSLPARCLGKGISQDGFPFLREDAGSCNLVHYKASNNQNFWLFHILNLLFL